MYTYLINKRIANGTLFGDITKIHDGMDYTDIVYVMGDEKEHAVYWLDRDDLSFIMRKIEKKINKLING